MKTYSAAYIMGIAHYLVMKHVMYNKKSQRIMLLGTE